MSDYIHPYIKRENTQAFRLCFLAASTVHVLVCYFALLSPICSIMYASILFCTTIAFIRSHASSTKKCFNKSNLLHFLTGSCILALTTCLALLVPNPLFALAFANTITFTILTFYLKAFLGYMASSTNTYCTLETRAIPADKTTFSGKKSSTETSISHFSGCNGVFNFRF